MKWYLPIATAFAVSVNFASASGASNYVLDLPEAKIENIETIGTVPPKRYIELDLGELRTREARLPGGYYSKEERRLMRARRALERQQAVTSARRETEQPNGSQPEPPEQAQMTPPQPPVTRPVVNGAPPQRPGVPLDIR